MYIGNTPFQGLVGGGNILDASIEGVDLSTSAIAARLGYTPVDPGAAVFSATVGISSGNLNFSSTGQKITGDFSNGTVANRTAFQTNTTNGATRLTVLPNGTGTISAINLHGASDPTNSSVAQFNLVDGTSAQVQSNRFGTGTYLPLTFHTSNTEQARIDINGAVLIGTATTQSSAGTTSKLVVYGATPTTAGDINLRLYDSGTSTILQLMRSGSTYNYAGIGASESAVYTTSTLNLAADGGIIKFNTGSTGSSAERARIDSAGKFGIGMTPAVALDVYNAGSGIIRVRGGTGNNEGSAFYVTKAANTGTLCAFGDWARIGGGTPDQVSAIWTADTPLMFHVYNAERMRIDTAGRLGIGTTSPTNGYKITIASSDNSSRIIQYQATTQADINSYVVGGIDLADVPRDGVSSNPAAYVRFVNKNTNSSFPTQVRGLDIVFGTVNGASGQGTAASERMRITANGAVGIGTATPSVEFEVYSRGRFGDGTNTLTMGYWDGFSNRIESVNKPLFLTSYSDSIRFGMSGSEVMRIHNNSNVGIGTTTPGGDMPWASPTLDIQGTRGSLVLRTTGTNGIATLRFKGPDANANDDWHINMGAGTNSTIQFSPKAGGGATGLVLKNDGGVGIGTTTPDSALHVAGSLFTNNATSIGVRAGMYAGTYAAIDMVSASGTSGWIDFHDTGGADYSERIRGGVGQLEFYTNGAGTPQVKLNSNGILITKNPIVVGSGMTGENGAAVQAPYSMILPIGTYYNGSGYSNYAGRLCKFPKSGDSRFVATIYSRGDFNYSYMVAETHIDVAVWSNSPGQYEFWAREVSGMTDVRFALDSDGYLWYYFPQLWTQEHIMVIYRIGNADLAISNATYHDTTLTWKTIAAATQYNEENNWGS